MGGAAGAAAPAAAEYVPFYLGAAFPPAPSPIAFLPRLPPPHAEGGDWGLGGGGGEGGGGGGGEAIGEDVGDAGARADLDGLQELDLGAATVQQDVRDVHTSSALSLSAPPPYPIARIMRALPKNN